MNNNEKWWIPSYVILEFDLVLKSRGFTNKERMEKYSLLMHDYPEIDEKTIPITTVIVHEVSRMEEVYKLDYFDAGVVATGLMIDGVIITPDEKIRGVKEIETIWE